MSQPSDPLSAPDRMNAFEHLIFDARDLDLATLLNRINNFGCVLIQNAFPKADIYTLYKRARRAYRNRDRQFQAGELHPDFINGLYQFGHIPLSDLDTPGQLPFPFVRQFSRSPLAQIGKGLWGKQFSLIVGQANPRRQLPLGRGGAPYEFHQDGTFLGDGSLILNFWIPLVPCGRERAGLEFVTVTPPELFSPQSGYHSLETIRGTYGDASLWHPFVDAGDVLLFTHRTLHRTYLLESMTKQRISLEMRCGDSEKLPVSLTQQVITF